jgi:hypothetical protein
MFELAGILSRSAGVKITNCIPFIIPQSSAPPNPRTIVAAIPDTARVEPVFPND